MYANIEKFLFGQKRAFVHLAMIMGLALFSFAFCFGKIILFKSIFSKSNLTLDLIERLAFISLIDAIYFSAILYIVFLAGRCWFRSLEKLAGLCFATVFILFLMNIQGAKSSVLTEKENGLYLFQDGNITPFGIFHVLFDPILAFSLLIGIPAFLHFLKTKRK